jgi:hypothetical protein
MHFLHQQSGIYRGEADGRYYVFLRWRDAAGRHLYQQADFATVAEASCFLTGALAACQVSKKAIAFDALTPGQYESRKLKS